MERVTALSIKSAVLNIAFASLAGLGILLALFGIGIDSLYGSFPGLSIPQILLIIAGSLLFLVCFRLRRGDARRRVWADIRGHWRAALLISLVTLLALELILTAGGIPTYYPPDIRGIPIEEAPWWTCDETGCSFVQEMMTLDEQDSAARAAAGGADFDERTRILFLGDSFTFGLSADIGKSYVEIIKANFPQSVIWNMGVPGTGTSHAWSLFQMYAPVLRPQIAILGFFINDFRESEAALNGSTRIRDMFAWRYGFIVPKNVMKLDAHSIYYYMHGVAPPANGIQRTVGNTRLGALTLKMIDIAHRTWGGEKSVQVDVTREYLRLLREAAAARDTALLVLLIPRRADVPPAPAAGIRYQTALRLLEELEMPYLAPIHALDAKLDYHPPGDLHWNTAGHQKVGAMLSDCLTAFEISGDWSACEEVVMP